MRKAARPVLPREPPATLGRPNVPIGLWPLNRRRGYRGPGHGAGRMPRPPWAACRQEARVPLSGPLAAFGFTALWHPELMAATLLLGAVYLQVVGPLRQRFPGARPVAWRARAAFLTGLLAVYAAQGSPLALLSNKFLFSAHVLQMVLLVFAAPPLLLAGTPDWLLRPALRVPAVWRSVVWLTSPVRALGYFVVVFCLYLLPPLTDLSLGNNWLYLLEHAVTLLCALAMWWPLVSPMPEAPPLPEPVQLVYTFLIELGMTVAFALVTFASSPSYPIYARAPRVFPLSPLFDQQAGGIIMRLGSMATFGVIFAQRFFRWAERERGRDPRGAPTAPGAP
jgi:putative membrane protein